jgi:hypothetical protein
MPKALDVPWDKIKETCEKGTPLAEVARLFNISHASIRMRSLRESWNTPKRVEQKLKQAAGSQSRRVAENASLAGQLYKSEGGQISPSTSTKVVDFDQATKDYRGKGVAKLAILLDQTIIAPPRNWKDYDIADKIMRRLLGIDDNEGKSSTIVSLQLVNERLQGSLQSEIIEGDFEAESVSQPSDDEPVLCENTGMGSAFSESDCDTPSEEEMPSV